MPGHDAARDGVEVRPSTIEGLGLFAARDVDAGDLIRTMNLLREVTDQAPLRPELGERTDHCNHRDGRTFLVGEPDRYLNHSCDPNAYQRHRDGRIELVARGPIAEGEEVRVDYLVNSSGGDSWPCRCGAARCRGATASSFFELPSAIQAEYRPLLADWFVARHRERLDGHR